MKKNVIVIPARYASSRYPGKPLAVISGKPMIQWVWEQAGRSELADRVIIATDDQRIVEAVEAFGGEAVMTSSNHSTGTDRIVEVAQSIQAENYINVQGDEPFVKPDDIDNVIRILNQNREADLATLCHPISASAALNENNVKVVFRHDGQALYFSRSPIPYVRDNRATSQYYKHIGLYGYRREALLQYPALEPAPLEQAEKLEQLRYLQAGFRIFVAVTDHAGPSVDTPADLNRAERYKRGVRPEEAELSGIRLLITDADGVLSPPVMIYGKDGEELKQFHSRDGLGLKLLMEEGIEIAVVSGRGSAVLEYRIQELGISEYRFRTEDKAAACREIMKKFHCSPEETLYIGDDLIDLPAFDVCGFSCTVADAPDAVKARAGLVLQTEGGNGVIRELADRILTARKQSREEKS